MPRQRGRDGKPLVRSLLQTRAPKVLIACALLLTWSYDTSPCFNMVEYFSGKAQVSAAFREAGYSVGSYDYLYNEKGMDFLSPGGFGLAMLLSLCTVPAGLHVMAPDCSSWTRISRGTSMRDALCTLGRLDLQWVRNGSLMIARVALLLFLCAAQHIVWLVEQPEGSSDVLFRHPRLDYFSNVISWVYVNSFWMMHFGHPSAKRTDLGPLTKEERESKTQVKPTRIVTSKATGKRSFQGTSDLKDTAHYPKGLGIALVNIFKNLGPQADLRGKPDLPMQASDRELFEAEPFGDPWWDAELPDVFFYLLKNKRLNIPESWKPTIMAFKAELEAVPRPESAAKYLGLEVG